LRQVIEQGSETAYNYDDELHVYVGVARSCPPVLHSRAHGTCAARSTDRRAVARWVLYHLIQIRLDDFADMVNTTRTRLQRGPGGPTSDHIPDEVRAAGSSYLLPVRAAAIAAQRSMLQQREGFFEPAFDDAAMQAWEELGSPELSCESVWDLWAQVVDRMAP